MGHIILPVLVPDTSVRRKDPLEDMKIHTMYPVTELECHGVKGVGILPPIEVYQQRS